MLTNIRLTQKANKYNELIIYIHNENQNIKES